MKGNLDKLLNTLPQAGAVEWIGVRPARRENLVEMHSVKAVAGAGLEGDRYSGSSGKRGVTLVQQEHLSAIASMLHIDEVHPQQLRRNIVVSGVNLLALKDKQFDIGSARLEYTGLCHPCSRMEETFGEGGYNAVRGHGGITARVIKTGEIRKGDELTVVSD